MRPDGPAAQGAREYTRVYSAGIRLARPSLAGRARKMPPTAVLAAFMPAGKGSLDRVGHLVEAFTPYGEWSPHDNVWIVALDYESGRCVAFGHENAPQVPLSDAVMASCAIPGWFRPVTIDGRTYIDGGAWSATSADLLAGLDLDEVYVLAPMLSFAMDQPDTVLGRVERRWRAQVTKRCVTEVGKLRAGGADVTILGPGPEDLEAMGQRDGQQPPAGRAGDVPADLCGGPARPRPGRPGPPGRRQLIRAYVPSTLPEVVGWYESGLVPAGTRINAVTRALRAQYPDADDEELEFLATKAAEEISTVAAMTSGHRRATLAVDLPGEVAAPVAGAVTSMTTTADVPVADWAALFVDDLEWYAIEEIPHLQ